MKQRAPQHIDNNSRACTPCGCARCSQPPSVRYCSYTNSISTRPPRHGTARLPAAARGSAMPSACGMLGVCSLACVACCCFSFVFLCALFICFVYVFGSFFAAAFLSLSFVHGSFVLSMFLFHCFSFVFLCSWFICFIDVFGSFLFLLLFHFLLCFVHLFVTNVLLLHGFKSVIVRFLVSFISCLHGSITLSFVESIINLAAMQH